jgi:hypothetical protein
MQVPALQAELRHGICVYDRRRVRRGAEEIMPTEFVEFGPEKAPATILLAHGAGAAMDSPV